MSENIVIHETPEECKQSFLDRFEDASSNDKWMAAIWCIRPDGNVEFNRTTCNFPRNEFSECVRLIRSNLSEELEPPIQKGPLPRANLRFMNREGNGENL